MSKPTLRYLAGLITLALLAGPASADRIELADGSTINGKILAAEGGKLKVETAFAGTIEIKQEAVKNFSTDEAVNVGLASGSAVLGKVAATDAGIKVAAANGDMTAGTAQVAAVWRQGDDSPTTKKLKAEAEALKRKWAYEASLAIAGRTGASEKFGAAAGFKATLASNQDKLIFSAAVERAKDNGVTTADRQFGGVDYSSFFSPDNGWYVRSSVEVDKIKSLDLRSSSAFGFSRKLLKKEKQDLEFRLGTGYRYESYSNGTNFSSLGLDLAFLHSYTFGNAKMNNSISYIPAFRDFTNYRVHHESSIEMPLTASLWKLRVGIANEYESIPPAGVDRLDTTYFTSLILNWK
jgi:putative salt-induced outer membrane protein YdiY